MNNGAVDVESLIGSIYSEEQVAEEIPAIPPIDTPINTPTNTPTDPPVNTDPPTNEPIELQLDTPAAQVVIAPELDTLISSDPDFRALEVPIADKAQLIEMAKGYSNLLDQVESLKNQLSNTPAAEFKTDAAKKLATFLENFSGEEEGVAEFAKVLSLRPDKMTDDEVLLEAFLYENKDLSLDKAKLFFTKRELSKYKVADEDDAEEQEILDIQKSRDAAKARQLLSKIKEEYKPVKVEAPSKDAGEAVFISNSSANISTIEKSLADFSTVLIEDPINSLPPIKISLTPEQQEQVRKECVSAISMRSSYDEKGAFKYHLNPKEMANSAAMALFGRKMLELTGSQRYKDGFAAAIKERAAVAPDRIVSGMPVETTREPVTLEDVYANIANGKK